MKLTRTLSLAATLFTAFCFVAPASAKKDKNTTPLPIDREATIHIIVHDNVMQRMRDSWTTPRMETERYWVMRDALRRAAEDVDYPGEVKIDRFAAGLADENQVLSLYVYRWEQGLESFGRSMTVEFAMDASLRIDDQEWDMGSFTARSSHYASGGVSSEDFRPAAERAIEQMIEMYRAAIAEAATTDK